MNLPHRCARKLVSLFFVLLTLMMSVAMAAPAPFDTTKSSGIVANPSILDFGSLQVGKSKTLTETLTNTASISLVVYSDTISGAGFTATGLTLPMTLTAGQSFTFSLTFTPQASGATSGNITLSSRNGHSKVVITLTGTGTAAGTLTVSPATLNFGSVAVGSSKGLAGALSAAGADVTVSSGTISTSEFKISGITFPVTIASGKSAAFTITFTPQASGNAAATATFVSDASNSPSVESLTGTGTAPPPHSVDLGWTPSTSADVIGYNIYRGSKSGGPYGKLNTALDPTITYDDVSVAGGQTYYYVTTAVDGSGTESTFSNQVKATIPTP